MNENFLKAITVEGGKFRSYLLSLLLDTRTKDSSAEHAGEALLTVLFTNNNFVLIHWPAWGKRRHNVHTERYFKKRPFRYVSNSCGIS